MPIIEIFSACLSPLIAVLLLYIAWRQHVTARGKYYSQTGEKRFLFDSDVTDYMEQDRKKALRLRQLSRKIEGLADDKEKERKAAVTEDAELFTWLGQQVEEVSGRFEKYLGFKKNL